jgi:hypothetical protein
MTYFFYLIGIISTFHDIAITCHMLKILHNIYCIVNYNWRWTHRKKVKKLSELVEVNIVYKISIREIFLLASILKLILI